MTVQLHDISGGRRLVHVIGIAILASSVTVQRAISGAFGSTDCQIKGPDTGNREAVFSIPSNGDEKDDRCLVRLGIDALAERFNLVDEQIHG